MALLYEIQPILLIPSRLGEIAKTLTIRFSFIDKVQDLTSPYKAAQAKPTLCDGIAEFAVEEIGDGQHQ
jgi:hypothetical protein